MLLRDYTLRVVLSDCNPSSQKVNAIAELSVDIIEVLPYLNSVLKGLQYNEEERILTVKRGGHLISFRPREIAITKLEDEDEARAVMEELKHIINDTYRNREQIKPTYTSRPIPKPLDIFKLLPGKNCKECGEPACLAFAVKLAGQEAGILKCSPLFSDKYQEKRKVLFELLHAAGYDVPSVSSATEKRLEG
jgi:ArsR family metal-binding transcriptional regulator